MRAISPVPFLCPECSASLRPDRTKINIEVDLCPDGHGILLDRDDVEALVGMPAFHKIEDLMKRSKEPPHGNCPNCSAPFHDFVVNTVRARGCTQCGALWFGTPDLQSHVLGVRRRAYGEHSMAGRLEVVRDAAAFMPGEIVAGILTDFQLEHGL